jgi:hypothetical protein
MQQPPPSPPPPSTSSSEWSDDNAMDFLFAPFAPRDTATAAAAASYDRKMAFWTGAIRRRCQHRRSATFSVQRLAGEFERYGQTPACLPTVVNHMIRSLCTVYAKYRAATVTSATAAEARTLAAATLKQINMIYHRSQG